MTSPPITYDAVLFALHEEAERCDISARVWGDPKMGRKAEMFRKAHSIVANARDRQVAERGR